MALLEKLWPAVSAVLTADGDVTGVLSVATTSGFYSGQLVELKATGLDALQLKVLEVLSATAMRVGAAAQSYEGSGTSCAGYSTALSATVVAKRQPKVFIGNDEVIASVYEAQPTTALRVMTVDRQGEYVAASGSGSAGSVSVTNVVSVTSTPLAASFQFIKILNTSISVGNASVTQALNAGSFSAAGRIIAVLSSLENSVGVSFNGVQISELAQGESFGYDLASNGRVINSSTTIGVWNISTTSTSGNIRFQIVS